MRRIILIAAMGLLALQAAAREPWQNGFSVGVEGNFALYDEKETVFNDFKGTTVSGSYTAFLTKGLFVRPMLMFYYEDHDYYPLDNSVPPGYPQPARGKSDKDDHLTEVGFGVACLGGYRFPVGKEFSVDLQTGPYYGIAIDQHQTIFGHHRFDLYNKSSLRWRFGLGLNVWRLTVNASFDLGLLKVRPEREHSDCESNVVNVGIGYNF